MKSTSRRKFVAGSFGGVAALGLANGLRDATQSGQVQGSGDRRPNIILIMADDMGFSDIGCYGSEIHTESG